MDDVVFIFVNIFNQYYYHTLMDIDVFITLPCYTASKASIQ